MRIKGIFDQIGLVYEYVDRLLALEKFGNLLKGKTSKKEVINQLVMGKGLTLERLCAIVI